MKHNMFKGIYSLILMSALISILLFRESFLWVIVALSLSLVDFVFVLRVAIWSSKDEEPSDIWGTYTGWFIAVVSLALTTWYVKANDMSMSVHTYNTVSMYVIPVLEGFLMLVIKILIIIYTYKAQDYRSEQFMEPEY